MKKYFYTLLSGTLLALLPAWAGALDMEYHTYGGHRQVVSALQRLALIFSDTSYRGIFMAFSVIGIVFGGAITAVRAISGNKVSLLGWAPPIVLGMMVFLGLVIPKGNLIVRDDVLNAVTTVGDIPDIIVLVAGTLNKIEYGFKEIVNTATADVTYDYDLQAGGIGFDLLLKAVSEPVEAKDSSLTRSVEQYVQDCMPIALSSPTTTLTLNEVRRATDNLVITLEKAALEGSATTYTDNGPNKIGTVMTCFDAWRLIKPQLSHTNLMTDPSTHLCGKMGANVADGGQVLRCMEILATQVNIASGGAITTGQDYLRQLYLAKVLAEAAQSDSFDALVIRHGNRSLMTQGVTIGMMANEWLPTLRAVITAIVLGMIPFILLLLATPIFGRVLMAMVGMLLWLTLWGIADIVITRSSIDASWDAFHLIKQARAGVDAFMLTPDASMQAVAIFGKARMMGIMMATVLAGTLFKISDHALAQMASNWSRGMEMAGTQTAMQSATAEGRASLVNSLGTTVATENTLANFGFHGLTAGQTNTAFNQAATGLAVQGQAGDAAWFHRAQAGMQTGQNIGALRAADMVAERVAQQTRSAVSREDVMRDLGLWQSLDGHGKARGQKELADKYGMPPDEFALHMGALSVLKNSTETDNFGTMVAKVQSSTGQDQLAAAKTLAAMATADLMGIGEASKWKAEARTEYMKNHAYLQMETLKETIKMYNEAGITPRQAAHMEAILNSKGVLGLARSGVSSDELAAAVAVEHLQAAAGPRSLEQVVHDRPELASSVGELIQKNADLAAQKDGAALLALGKAVAFTGQDPMTFMSTSKMSATLDNTQLARVLHTNREDLNPSQTKMLETAIANGQGAHVEIGLDGSGRMQIANFTMGDQVQVLARAESNATTTTAAGQVATGSNYDISTMNNVMSSKENFGEFVRTNDIVENSNNRMAMFTTLAEVLSLSGQSTYTTRPFSSGQTGSNTEYGTTETRTALTTKGSVGGSLAAGVRVGGSNSEDHIRSKSSDSRDHPLFERSSKGYRETEDTHVAGGFRSSGDVELSRSISSASGTTATSSQNFAVNEVSASTIYTGNLSTVEVLWKEAAFRAEEARSHARNTGTTNENALDNIYTQTLTNEFFTRFEGVHGTLEFGAKRALTGNSELVNQVIKDTPATYK